MVSFGSGEGTIDNASAKAQRPGKGGNRRVVRARSSARGHDPLGRGLRGADSKMREALNWLCNDSGLESRADELNPNHMGSRFGFPSGGGKKNLPRNGRCLQGSRKHTKPDWKRQL